MRITVSREAAYDSQGRKLCSRCKRRPRKKGQRHCKECHAEYMREWREGRRGGLIQVLLTPDEWALVKAFRQQKAKQ